MGVLADATERLLQIVARDDQPRRRVEIDYLAPGEQGDRGNAPPGAEGRTVFYVRDNGVGIQGVLEVWLTRTVLADAGATR